MLSIAASEGETDSSRLDNWFVGLGRTGSQRGHREWWMGQIHITLILLSTVGNSGQFESTIKGRTHAPSAQPWNQVGVELHTQTLLWTSP